MNENPSIGPWRVLEGETAFIVNANDTIARCVRFAGEPCRHSANARLMAAAPEMLAALIRIVDAMETRDGDEIVPGINAAKEAIAKATGGEA